MSATLSVGLTGGIGAGKSVALAALARRGARTLSLDRIARAVMARGGPGYRRVRKAFGSRILGAGGAIDRARLAGIVFNDAGQRRRLEKLVHPLILREMRARARKVSSGVLVVDVPLLFEAGLAREFDVTLLVSAPRARRALRLKKRDGLGAAEIAARIAAQMPERRKRALADVVVDNDGSKKDFEKRLDAYYRSFELIRSGGIRNGKRNAAA